jgi:hypothetical protein
VQRWIYDLSQIVLVNKLGFCSNLLLNLPLRWQIVDESLWSKVVFGSPHFGKVHSKKIEVQTRRALKFP